MPIAITTKRRRCGKRARNTIACFPVKSGHRPSEGLVVGFLCISQPTGAGHLRNMHQDLCLWNSAVTLQFALQGHENRCIVLDQDRSHMVNA
jgi:hypothetical protein